MGNMPAKITGKYRSYDINGTLPTNSSYTQASTLKVHRRPVELMTDDIIENERHSATDVKKNSNNIHYFDQPSIDPQAYHKPPKRREPYQIEAEIDEIDNDSDEIKEHNIDQIQRLEESIYNTNNEHMKQFSSSSNRSSQIIEASADTSPYTSRVISHLNNTNQHRRYNHEDDDEELEDEHMGRGINYRKVDVIY